MAVTGVSHICLLIEQGPICNSIATSYHCDLRVERTRVYIKTIMEIYGKTFTGLGPKEKFQEESKFDQDIPQSQTADQPKAQRGRATGHLQ